MLEGVVVNGTESLNFRNKMVGGCAVNTDGATISETTEVETIQTHSYQ